VEDLQRTVMTPDGRRMLEFKRDSEDGTTISVSVEYKSDQPPSISGELSRKVPARPLTKCQ
jgi:hypothetical protein